MIDQLRAELFAAEPSNTLYHYTSLQGLMGIIESRTLRASDVRYMNDSTELKYAFNLLQKAIAVRTAAQTKHDDTLFFFSTWLRDQINKGPMLFSASFRANGNLLSQWRGYASHGKGMSLGFNPGAIKALATEQRFSLGQCLYNPEQQSKIIETIIDRVLAICASSSCLQASFDQLEGALLGICALFKHPAFAEEQEWRIVSQPYACPQNHPIGFREGKAMLVPFYRFNLAHNGAVRLDHVFVGPTPNADLSVTALMHYLTMHKADPTNGISECDIPYRQR